MKRVLLNCLGPLACGAWLLCAPPSPAVAQSTPGAMDATALAKKTQNPVGDLVSLPFQFNFNSGGGYDDHTFFNLNFQPVVPIKISPKTNIVVRAIVPFVNLPGPTPLDRTGGIADIQAQLFFTPAQPGKLIWGVGPMFSLPTATNDLVATGAWAIGPGAVALTMTGPWVLGGLLVQVWTFADEGGLPETNTLTFQPFVNYNFGKGWAISSAPLLTMNQDAPSGQEWTIPLGLGITRTTQFNGRPISTGLQYYSNVEHPDGAAASQLRFVFSLLYPTGPKPAARTP